MHAVVEIFPHWHDSACGDVGVALGAMDEIDVFLLEGLHLLFGDVDAMRHDGMLEKSHSIVGIRI